MREWELIEAWGTAAELHGDRLPVPDHRLVRVARVPGAAMVLGSAQVATDVDHRLAAELGVEVARRRSGGGAVLLRPGHQVWLDIGLPRDDPLWEQDVGRSAGWLGAALTAALVDLGVAGAEPHQGRFRSTPWSPQVCFAGLAPGEVTVGGRKLVGISQRRSRPGAVFQVAVALVWAPTVLLDLLRLPDEATPAVAAAGVGLEELVAGAEPGDVIAAVSEALPT